MTQKGFRANLSLPLHPLYRQQHPADQILTMYSTPKTTMVTISYKHTDRRQVSMWSMHTLNRYLCDIIYQDVEGVFWALLIFFDGGEHGQNQTGENQQKTETTREKTVYLLYLKLLMLQQIFKKNCPANRDTKQVFIRNLSFKCHTKVCNCIADTVFLTISLSAWVLLRFLNKFNKNPAGSAELAANGAQPQTYE